jgi:hypothetical protein
MADIKEGDQIPYPHLAAKLFPDDVSNGQMFVPFLGAGVSISGRTFTGTRRLTSPPPDRDEINRALSSLRLEGKGKVFIELAIVLAYLIEMEEKASREAIAHDLYERLKEDQYPPSAGELAQLFSERASYTSFSSIVKALRKLFPEQLLAADEKEQIETLRLLAQVTRIANPPETLTSITSYFERSLGREDLWNMLKAIFETKTVPTRTHELLALAAQQQLSKPGATDYLIITTNYDCLMESALDKLSVPYVVLTTKKGSDPKVLIRCSQTVREREALKNRYWNKLYPGNFTLIKSESLVIIYKIHGCLSSELGFANEGVVISDNDYVDYVSQMARKDGVIPVHVTELMREKSFWFLGYSLSDWNVRSIYETVKAKSNPERKTIKDFSVMYSVGDFEKLFFEKNDITIFQASLNDFVDGILKHLPPNVSRGN